VRVVVDEDEARRSASTIGSLEPVQDDVLGVSLELLGHEVSQVLVGHVGDAFVEHIQHDLLPGQQFVNLSSARSDGDGHELMIN
jgi:hypothetical protein